MQNKVISTAASMPSVIRAIQDGDLVNTANCGNNGQDTADGLGYLLARANRFDAAHGTASAAHVQPAGGFATTGDWTYAAGAWTNAVVGTVLMIPLAIPNGVTVTAVSVLIDPAGGHGALPAVMPSLAFRRRAIATGGATVIGTATDASANVAAYEPAHALTLSGLSEVIDTSIRDYHLFLTAESGANSAVGTVWYGGVSVTWTPA